MRLQHGSFLRPSMIGPCVSVLKRSDADHQCPEGVTGGKAASEDVGSALHQPAEIARSAFHCSVNVVRITRSGSEQFHAQLWANNATRLSGMEWLWSAKRA